MGVLIGEINNIVAAGEFDRSKLTPASREVLDMLPAHTQQQLLLDRDPHGNVQVHDVPPYGGVFCNSHFYGGIRIKGRRSIKLVIKLRGNQATILVLWAASLLGRVDPHRAVAPRAHHEGASEAWLQASIPWQMHLPRVRPTTAVVTSSIAIPVALVQGSCPAPI